MKLKSDLARAIRRSERAYQGYVEDRRYFQAARIYYANLVVYQLLEAYLLVCPEEEVDQVCDYIYHLEDWIAQFECSQGDVAVPTEKFVFHRWEGAVAFPNAFVSELKKIIL